MEGTVRSRSVLQWAEAACTVGAGVIVVVTMTLVAADAIGRYFFSSPIGFQYNLTTQYLMPVILLLPLSWAFQEGAFIKLDVLESVMPERLTAAVNAIALALTALVFALITVYSAIHTYEAWVEGDIVMGAEVDWPVYLALIWIPIACSVLTLRLVANAFRSVRQPFNGEDE